MAHASTRAAPLVRLVGVNVDVLVVGCGPAGASAAIAAHDTGANVLIVEKRRHGGGNALFAGGFLWDPLQPPGHHHGPGNKPKAACKKPSSPSHLSPPRPELVND